MVIASYGKDGTPDTINAAWGSIAGGNQIFLCLSSNHKTVENTWGERPLLSAWRTRRIWWRPTMWGWFPKTMFPTKWSGLHVTRSEFVDAPVIGGLSLVLECGLASYDP